MSIKRICFLTAYLLLYCFCGVVDGQDQITGQVLFSGKQQALITSEVRGTVEKIRVEFGQYFKKGAVLVEYDDAIPVFEKKRADAELVVALENLKYFLHLNESKLIERKALAVVEAAETHLGVVLSLHRDGGVSDSELAAAVRDKKVAEIEQEITLSALVKDQARAELEVAVAELNVAQAQKKIDACRIVAPFNGRVVKLFVKEHEIIESSQPVIDIVGDAVLTAQFLLNEDQYSQCNIGTNLKIYVPLLKKTVLAVVTHKDSVVDPASHTFEVHASVNNNLNLIRPGMTGLTRFEDVEAGVMK